MNFKYFILLLCISACGVKGDPAAPKGQSLPSVLDNYKDIQVKQPLNETQAP